jgi:hypothetical protein
MTTYYNIIQWVIVAANNDPPVASWNVEKAGITAVVR